jgi:hypothetical protein
MNTNPWARLIWVNMFFSSRIVDSGVLSMINKISDSQLLNGFMSINILLTLAKVTSGTWHHNHAIFI